MYLSKFITEDIRKSIIKDVNMYSNQDRIKQFFQNTKNYEIQMLYRQQISKWMVYIFINNWRALKDFSFLLVIIINFCLLFTVQMPLDDKIDSATEFAYRYLGFIQMAISFIVYISCMIETYKVSLSKQFINNFEIEKQQAKTID